MPRTKNYGYTIQELYLKRKRISKFMIKRWRIGITKTPIKLFCKLLSFFIICSLYGSNNTSNEYDHLQIISFIISWHNRTRLLTSISPLNFYNCNMKIACSTSPLSISPLIKQLINPHEQFSLSSTVAPWRRKSKHFLVLWDCVLNHIP